MEDSNLTAEKRILPGKRMTLSQCRKVAPELSDLTDEELLEARDILYELAQLAYEAWKAQLKSGSKNPAGVLTPKEDGSNVK